MIKKIWKSASGRKIFFLGLGLGFVVTSSAMFWVSQTFLDSEEFEADDNAHLGLKSDTLPVVALRPISTERLTRFLKIKTPEEAMKLTRVFADRIASGFLPKGWNDRCEKEFHPAVCLALTDYFKAFEARTAARKQIPRRSRIVFADAKIPRLQADDLGTLLGLSSKQPKPKLAKWTALALKTETCPRNFSIALARMWEYYAEDEGGWNRIAELDKHGLSCLSTDDPNAEYVFFRAGLLAYSAKTYEVALEYFKKAQLSNTRREPYRVNYWAARTLDAMKRPDEARSYREQVIVENPLSWQAIRTYTELGRDPMAMIREIEPFRDRHFSDDDKMNLRLAWFYLLTRLDNTEYATGRYTELLAESMDSTTPRGVFQHVARVLDNVSQHRLQIMILNKMYALHPDALNIETLRLYYPKPYFDEIDASSPNIDTAVLLGLVRQESGFDAKAHSGANARGLLQVLPSTAREVRRRTPAEKLYDSSTNIQVGAAYYLRLVGYFDGSFEKGLAAYNAGMGRVRDWDHRYAAVAQDTQLFMDMIPYRETREYVSSILRNAYWYHRLFPELTLSLRDGVQTSALLKEELAEQIKSYVPVQAPSGVSVPGTSRPEEDKNPETQDDPSDFAN
ncbi:MAG: lytic transglycosylase domain-containing protein [Bdellovibrionota bacterium]